MIDGQVMRKQPHEPSSAGRIMRGVDLHQRRPTDIDAMAARIVARLELLSDVAIARIEFDDVQRQRRATLHDLDGVRQPFPEERGAQDVMPVDHLLQCRQKTIQPLARTKCEQIAFQIGIALLAQQMVEQHAFLHRYERIDILNVRRAAVHARDQRIDLALIQSNQRQLLRRDTFGVGRYPVRRHANRAAHGAMPVLDQVINAGLFARNSARRPGSSSTFSSPVIARLSPLTESAMPFEFSNASRSFAVTAESPSIWSCKRQVRRASMS
ncbi:hypothetical protein X962_6364 [Burkholderia pseudomallei MSHR7343]|nr:hypothetical protein X962_6364 [Burkholderia pseudomallei MSHR7343]